ncbi:MAG: YdcF family protein [Holophagaceae bacterium]|nr:YdcF family protein [Holophagaceae bacterium]
MMDEGPVPIYAAPPRATFWQMLGPGGLISFGLALLGGGLLLGVPVLWRLRQVLKAADGTEFPPSDVILVLGRRLQNDRPTKVFEARLDHAAGLLRDGMAPRIVIAGGLTGKASISEAEVGRERLVGQGIHPDNILLEDRSQHTLENLFNLRETLREENLSTLILVSDPLHLARAGALARGLGLAPRCSPATACPPLRGSAGWWARACYEAFLLHWYHTGVAYSRIIKSEAQLKRLT